MFISNIIQSTKINNITHNFKFVISVFEADNIAGTETGCNSYQQERGGQTETFEFPNVTI